MEALIQAEDTSSNNKDPLSMEIDTPDLLSANKNSLNEHSASSLAIDQSKISKNETEQSLDSTIISNLQTSKNPSNADNVDQTNTTTSDLVELTDLGIENPIKNTSDLEMDQSDTNIGEIDRTNDVEMIAQTNANINKVNNSESATNNNEEQQNIPIDIMEQSNSHQPDKLTSAENGARNSDNTSTDLGSVQSLDQPNTDSENSHQEIVTVPNSNTKSIDQVNINNEKSNQSCVIQENSDQPSTSKTNSNEINISTLEMLHQLGTVVKKLDQPTSNQENTEKKNAVSQTETKEWVPSEEKVQLFTEDKGPHWHNVVNNLVTLPVIATNLPKIFKSFPIFGKPENRASVESFYERQIRDFVGCDLNDAEYEELQDYCSIDNLRTGKEFTMNTKIPHVGIPMGGGLEQMPTAGDKPDLFVLRKLKARMQRDPRNMYAKKLKYRGVRLIPMSSQEEQLGIAETEPPDLEPGKDVLYRIRVYRPFMFSTPRVKAQIRGRHSVFSCDVVVCGRQPLTVLRDRLVCRNDADLRLDVSRRPHDRATTTAKDMFPSGFLFINNVFYVDRRAGCRDTSAVIRQWAAQRGIGRFPVQDMAAVCMQDVNVRLAHPEVYVHQGNCEHVFLVSEIRLLNYSDPLHVSCYPCHTAVSHNQTIYCTTCAEFGAKWIVTGCDRVPFDPAFFCDICFKQYLYKDGKKIGDFKAYAYKGNELSMLKPQS